MQRIFKTRPFGRWARKVSLLDQALCGAVAEMARGLIDADLGGGVVKKRVALSGRRKSGGARTLVATNRDNRWFFMYGFAKNERASISGRELAALQKLANDLLGLSSAALDIQAAKATLEEICHD
ncbi:MAG: type II toxin-antitoxin system RelE/ParE family toxin [Magnetococcales bacterium]|nr:type II toxin-antitoxin system RelE/ParE family toxin [Magnetococcales bacterium]